MPFALPIAATSTIRGLAAYQIAIAKWRAIALAIIASDTTTETLRRLAQRFLQQHGLEA